MGPMPSPVADTLGCRAASTSAAIVRSAIRPVLATEVPALAAAMGRAFFDDPGAIFVEPDVSRRAQVNAGFFAVFIRLGLALGEVVATPDLAGVAVWLPPAHPT